MALWRLPISVTILTLEVKTKSDLNDARLRAAQIANLLGFNEGDRYMMAQAVFIIAQNGLLYAGCALVEFLVGCEPP